MKLDAGIGSVEEGDDSVVHPAYPALRISLPITAGTAFPKGTVLQIDGATHKLEVGDLTTRSYILDEDLADDDANALVVALGAVRFEKLLVNGVAITSVQAITLMEKSPLVVI